MAAARRTSTRSTRQPAAASALFCLLFLLSFLFTDLVLPASALHKDEAGIVDWHRSFIGKPLVQLGHYASPRFHRILSNAKPRSAKASTAIFTATEKNVVAALNPRNGDIVWRQVLSESEPVLGIYPYGDVVLSLSGSGGAIARLYEGQTGYVIWEAQHHQPIQDGVLPDLDYTGAGAAFFPNGTSDDVLTLANGGTIRRLEAASGKVLWSWNAEDATASRLALEVFPTSTSVYLVLLTKSFASHTLSIAKLDAKTGALLSTSEVASSIVSLKDVVVLSNTDASLARVAWLEKGKVKAVGVESGSKVESIGPKTSAFTELVDPRIGQAGFFVAKRKDGQAEVLRAGGSAKGQTKLDSFWVFDDETYDEIYSGVYDKQGRPYIGRIFQGESMNLANVHVLWCETDIGTGMVSGYAFPYYPAISGVIEHATLEVARVGEFQLVARATLTSSSGAVSFWHDTQNHWTREEGLSDITKLAVLDLPELKVSGLRSLDEPEGLVARLARHVVELRDLPSFLVRFTRRFATGTYATSSDDLSGQTPSDVDESASVADGSLWRDTFGFRKLFIAATAAGRVFAIDSAGRGRTVWDRTLAPYGKGSEAEKGIVFKYLGVSRTASAGLPPLVVAIAELTDGSGNVVTKAYEVNALTGEPSPDTAKGVKLFDGPARSAFFVQAEDPSSRVTVVACVDEQLKVHLYPSTDPARNSFAELAPRFFFFDTHPGGPEGNAKLTGFTIAGSASAAHKSDVSVVPTWELPLATGEKIHRVVHQKSETVASVGRVLGDRSTLYKYLNPHAAVVTTVNPARMLGKVYLVDTVKGSVLWSVEHENVDAGKGLVAAFTDNWLVYVFESESGSGMDAKGAKAVTVEFYESLKSDVRIKSDNFSSFSPSNANPEALVQTYLFPFGVRALATTTTKHGITVKSLIAATDRDQLFMVPRRFLDPRRPHRKPTAQEAEEGLFAYAPLIPPEPQWIISHDYYVARVVDIVTCPTLLESTSLVLAHGLDLFYTRVTPSKTFDLLSESFNKVQLLLTIAGLSAAIFITSPMVRIKKLNARWG